MEWMGLPLKVMSAMARSFPIHPNPATPFAPGLGTVGAMSQSLREYIDQLRTEGYAVADVHGEDPYLIDPLGNAVETWQDKYPYDELISRTEYEAEKRQLQIELLKFQYSAQDHGTKHVIIFEGRDAAGKGGAIKRFTEHLNPRTARTVALGVPTEREKGQWYFQRYISTCPPRARWCCSTAPGTTAPASSG